MYRNLKAEMVRIGLTLEKMSPVLGITEGTLCAKLNYPNRLKYCECLKIRDNFFPDLTIDYLFEVKENDNV